MGTAKRIRLDLRVVELDLAPSRQRAQALIRANQVLVDDVPRDKPGTLVTLDARIRVRGTTQPYVSRGGLKLASVDKTPNRVGRAGGALSRSRRRGNAGGS